MSHDASRIRRPLCPPTRRRRDAPSAFAGHERAAAKVREFPQTPGVYLMKDSAGRVIYVGKAKNLRARAGSYFLKAAAEDRRTADLVREIADIDYLEAESEVDALLARSPADQGRAAQVQPGSEGRQDVSVPGDHHARGFSARRVHARAARAGARSCTARSPAPAACAARCRCCRRFSNSAPARSTSTRPTRSGAGSGPACWPRSTSARPPATCGSRRKNTAATSSGCGCFWKARRQRCSSEMKEEMRTAAAAARSSKRPPGCATKSTCSKRSTSAASWKRTSSPRCSSSIPRRAWPGCKRCSSWPSAPRTIEGVDIAHLGGGETVASLVQFIDGLPFKPDYRRYKIRDVKGVDDFASIREVDRPAVPAAARRVADLSRPAADRRRQGATLQRRMAAFRELQIEPPVVISLAKREEEIYVPERTSRCG